MSVQEADVPTGTKLHPICVLVPALRKLLVSGCGGRNKWLDNVGIEEQPNNNSTTAALVRNRRLLAQLIATEDDDRMVEVSPTADGVGDLFITPPTFEGFEGTSPGAAAVAINTPARAHNRKR